MATKSTKKETRKETKAAKAAKAKEAAENLKTAAPPERPEGGDDEIDNPEGPTTADLLEGVETAIEAIASGTTENPLRAWMQLTRDLANVRAVEERRGARTSDTRLAKRLLLAHLDTLEHQADELEQNLIGGSK